MQLKPRHYVLFLIIVGVFVFNIVRNHRKPPAPLVNVPHITTAAPAQTPAWAAFDHAASLRDAPDADFQPALRDLHQLLDATHDSAAADIRGCLTWLEFYRQGMAQIRSDPQMKDRSLHHLNGCTRYHLDTTL